MPELQKPLCFLTLFHLSFSDMQSKKTLKPYHDIYQQQDDFLRSLDLADCGFCQNLAFFLLLSRLYTQLEKKNENILILLAQVLLVNMEIV